MPEQAHNCSPRARDIGLQPYLGTLGPTLAPLRQLPKSRPSDPKPSPSPSAGITPSEAPRYTHASQALSPRPTSLPSGVSWGAGFPIGTVPAVQRPDKYPIWFI